MGNLKFAIIGLGVVGIIALVALPFISISMMGQTLSIRLLSIPGGGAEKGLLLGGFGLATVMGVMAMKQGLQKWIAGVSLVGFALAILKVRDGFSEGHGIGAKLALVCAGLGCVVSILGLIKGDAKA